MPGIKPGMKVAGQRVYKNNSAGISPRHDNSNSALRSAEAALSAAAAVSATTTRTTTRSRARGDAGLHRQKTLTLHLLARELAGPADRFRLFPRFLFGWFFVMAAEFHLAENALALHLLLERLAGLVDVVVSDENLQTNIPSLLVVGSSSGIEFRRGRCSKNGRIRAGPRAFTRTEGESPRYLGAGSPWQDFP